MDALDQPEFRYCFACGEDNPVGLHLKKRYEEGRAVMDFTVTPEYCGFENVLHGGILSTIADEAMAYAIMYRGLRAVTAKISVSFKNPALAGSTIRSEGRVERMEGRKIKASAVTRSLSDGRVISEAEGIFVIVDIDKFSA